jgi:hypothetical protein
MSAPTALESGALARGIAWMNRPKPKPGPRNTATERRSSTGLAVLGRDHDDLCRQASDPLEIAAVLESAGLTDSQARSRYRSAGVFEVAEQLWQEVPWRPAHPEARADRWAMPLWRSQLRGVLYAVPAVIAAVIPARLTGGLDYTLLALATAVAIAATQALSMLGHLLAGRGQTRALAQLAMVALGGALAVTGVAAEACLVTGARVTSVLAPGGQLLFVVAATLLLVGGRDRLLLALVAPGLTVIGLELGGVLPAPADLVASAATVLVAAVGAWVAVGRGRDGESVRSAVGRVELTHAGVAACYGLGLSALVTYAVIGAASGRVPGAGGWLLVASLPLTATIGLSEYLLHRARSRCMAALAATGSLGRGSAAAGFTAGAHRQLRGMVGVHALAVGVVAGAVLVWLQLGNGDPQLRGYAAGYAVLGLALALTTTLFSLGYGGLAALLACAGGSALLLVDVLPGVRGQQLVVAQLGVIAALFLVAYRLTAVTGAPTRC